MHTEHPLIPRLTDDQRRHVRALTSLRDTVAEVLATLHLAEVDEADDEYRGYCSCGTTFTPRPTLADSEHDVLEHLSRS